MTPVNAINRRILVIDDSPSIHDDFRKILVGEPGNTGLAMARAALFGSKRLTPPPLITYQMDSAMQGTEGIDMVRKAMQEIKPYAMAFVDMRMPPGLDGMQTIQRLWKVDPRLQVVICTAYSDYGWNDVIDTLGQSDRLLILKKPFDTAEVSQLACALTAKWDLSRRAELREIDLERMVDDRTRELKLEIERRTIAEDRLAHGALHDKLTDLPNRALLVDRLSRCIERGKRMAEYKIAVLMLDFDEFKVINDSLGHAAGDEFLMAAAERLNGSLRTVDTVSRSDSSTDTMARTGGDEFVLLLDDIRHVDDAILVAERIKQNMSKPFHIGGKEIVTTVSIGIAVYTGGEMKSDELLRDADTALHRAKAHGKARHVIFDQDMRVKAVERLEVEGDLRKAIERNELFVQYQPIVCLRTGAIEGFEALVRWHHPQKGIVSPDAFIPLAEQTGLIVPLGQWVLSEACSQLRTWKQRFAHCASLTMSVNLSMRQFNDSALLNHIDAVLKREGLNPRHLKLEITESMLMEETDNTGRLLGELKSRNLDLHIDDFGTGYSSLSYLHNLPVDALKIDRSFVSNMGANGENASTVAAVLTLAHNQGLRVIAEGIETTEQMAQLQSLHCDLGQGYYFSKPLNAEDAATLLGKGRQWRQSA